MTWSRYVSKALGYCVIRCRGGWPGFISTLPLRRIKSLGGSAARGFSRTAVRAEHFAFPPDMLGGYTLKNLLGDWKMLATVAGAAVAGFSLIAYAFFRPAIDPEEAERKRRLHLNQIG